MLPQPHSRGGCAQDRRAQGRARGTNGWAAAAPPACDRPPPPLLPAARAPLDVGLPRRLQHVEGHHGVVVEDDGVVGLDEAHAAHVGREVEHVVHVGHHLLAVVKHAQVHQVELVAEVLVLRCAWGLRACLVCEPPPKTTGRRPLR